MMSDPSVDAGNTAVQELFANLSKRPQQSSRAEAPSVLQSFAFASPSPSHSHASQARPSSSNILKASSFSSPANISMSIPDGSGQDSKAHLLNLLNFGGQKESLSNTSTPRTEGLPLNLGAQQHARGVSAADLVGSSMGKPIGMDKPTSPSVETLPSSQPGQIINPQDQILQLLSKTPQQQRPSVSRGASISSEVKAVQPEAGFFQQTSAKASSSADLAAAVGGSPHPGLARDSPIRLFGTRESRETTPFEPQNLATPSSKPVDRGIFTYVNPFEQLASSGKDGSDASAVENQPSKNRNGQSSPDSLFKSAKDFADVASPEPLADGRTRMEALMGIGAPTTDPDVFSQALENVAHQVEKQVVYEAALQGDEPHMQINVKQESSSPGQIVEAAGSEIDRAAVDVKREIETEDIRQALIKLATDDGSDAIQDMMDEAAAAADDEESSNNDDEYQIVPVYNIPLRPFVAIDLAQPELPSLNFRERSITDIARVKKEFDQIDRNLVTASEDYIIYSTPKKPFGIRVIQQEDGKDRQLFKENDPIFNVAISSSPSGKVHEGIETVIATGTSGAVYWSVIRYDGRDQSQDEQVAKHCLVFPPFSTSEGDHTSGGQLKTRAKRSNRHPEFFAIGRGKTIQIVFPFHAMNSKFVKKGSVVDSEAYFKERSIKIGTGKAGKDFTFSEDDTVLASLDKAGRLRFWDVRDLVDESNGTASKLAPLEVTKPIMTVPTAHVNDKAWPTSVLFVDKIRPYVRGSALRYVIVGTKQNHTLQLWDLSLGKVVQELALPHENESDAICSVAFHPATGIIVVGHPTRNSIYFIHLSAPKYNLQGITQAKYLQAIIQKNPNLPKLNSTAIMSGVREYSFASKGQIRSLDLLSSQNSSVDKKLDDDRGQFELYVMHSKGVTCLNIRKADLGWSDDNKVITKVDGEEAGMVRVRNLQELKPVEISEMSSVNGDAVGSTKGMSSRALSPLPEAPGRQERDSGIATGGEAPINGGAIKSEKRKKKRTEHPTEEVFDDMIPPPAPVPPTAPFAPSTSRSSANSQSQVSKKESRVSKKDPKEELVQTPKQPLALPSTEITPPPTENLSEIIQNHMSKFDESVKTAISQAMEADFKILRRNIEDDRRAADASALGHQEAILRLVSQSLSENVDQALDQMIASSIEKKVLPAITQHTEKALRKIVPEWLNSNLPQHLQVKPAVSEAIGNAMGNQQFLNTLTDGVTNKISKRIDRETQSTIIPQFQKVVDGAIAESKKRVTEQLKASEAKVQDDTAKIDKLTLVIEDLQETLRRFTETQSAMRDEMNALKEEVSRLRLTQSTVSDPQAAGLVEAPVESPEDQELNAIVSLISSGCYEEGTVQWLQSPNQSSIFNRFFIKCDPGFLAQCSNLVILSAGAAVVSDLEDSLPQRLQWVATALECLTLAEDEVKEIVPRITEHIIHRLESRYMSLAEAEPQHVSLKQIPLLVKKAREVKAQALAG